MEYPLIKDLPTPYDRLALIRCWSGEDEQRELMEAFIWSESPEGHDFWEEVNQGGSPPLPAISLYHLIKQPIIGLFG